MEQRNDLETMLVVLKDMQRMFLCEGVYIPEQEGDPAHLVFRRALGVHWQMAQDNRAVTMLAPFPTSITLFVKDYGDEMLRLNETEFWMIVGPERLTPEIKTDYHTRSREFYGGLVLAKTMPRGLAGKA